MYGLVAPGTSVYVPLAVVADVSLPVKVIFVTPATVLMLIVGVVTTGELPGPTNCTAVIGARGLVSPRTRAASPIPLAVVASI